MQSWQTSLTISILSFHTMLSLCSSESIAGWSWGVFSFSLSLLKLFLFTEVKKANGHGFHNPSSTAENVWKHSFPSHNNCGCHGAGEQIRKNNLHWSTWLVHYLHYNGYIRGHKRVVYAVVSCVPAGDCSSRIKDCITIFDKASVSLLSLFRSLLRCSGLLYWSVLFQKLSLMRWILFVAVFATWPQRNVKSRQMTSL